MEKHESTCKQGKKKAQISIAGANVGGLVMWGGALAVAGLIAAFAVKKSTRRDANKKDSCKKEDKGSEGLRFILQTPASSFHHSPCSTSYGSTRMDETQINSCHLVPTESLIMGENPTPMINGRIENPTSGHQEIILIDDSEQESIASFDDCGGIEECSLPLLAGPVEYKEENRIKDDSGEDLLLTEVIGIRKEVEAADAEKITAEKTPPIHPVEKEEEDDDDMEDRNDEYSGGTEEGSERTGSTSTESNVEAIWPEESIEALSLELTDTVINRQNSAEKASEEHRTAKTDKHGHRNNGTSNTLNNDTDKAAKNPTFLNKEKTLAVAVSDQAPHTTRWSIWIWSTLALVLLMLLLISHRNALSCYIRNRDFFLVPLDSEN